MAGTVFHFPIVSVILKRARRRVGGSRTGQVEAAYSQQSEPSSSSEAQRHHHKTSLLAKCFTCAFSPARCPWAVLGEGGGRELLILEAIRRKSETHQFQQYENHHSQHSPLLSQACHNLPRFCLLALVYLHIFNLFYFLFF